MTEKNLPPHIPYNPSLNERARYLRNNTTHSERHFWNALRQMPFYKTTKFNRQKPIGEYIVDFYCHEHRLVIEIDGDTHCEEDVQRKDQSRTAFLESKGLRVVRFTNPDVVSNIEGVMEVLQLFFEEKT